MTVLEHCVGTHTQRETRSTTTGFCDTTPQSAFILACGMAQFLEAEDYGNKEKDMDALMGTNGQRRAVYSQSNPILIWLIA